MSKKDCALSVEETNRLIAEIQANPSGATCALEKLTTSLGDLVQSQAHKCHQTNLHQDLVQEGYLALLEAVHRFDASRGVRFSTYVTTCIRNRMLKLAIAESEQVNNNHRRRFYPDDKGAAEWAGRKSAALAELSSDGGSERAFAERLEYRRLEKKLGFALDRLSQRQQEAVLLEFFHEESHSKMAARLKVSQPRVTALTQTSLKRLRFHLQAAA